MSRLVQAVILHKNTDMDLKVPTQKVSVKLRSIYSMCLPREVTFATILVTLWHQQPQNRCVVPAGTLIHNTQCCTLL